MTHSLGKILAPTIAIALTLAIAYLSAPVSANAQPSPSSPSAVSKPLIQAILEKIESKYIDPAQLQQSRWQIARQRLLNRDYPSLKAAYTAIRETVSHLNDSYTRFYDPEEFNNLKAPPSGEMVSVGLQIWVDPKTQQIRVRKVIADSSAQRMGIQPGDILVKVNEKPIQGLDIIEVIRQLRGTAGTNVTVTIERNKKTLNVPLTRLRVSVESVRWSRNNSLAVDLGYIRCTQFTAGAGEEMRRAIQALERESVRGYILDLRGNPGGLLESGIDIARLWLNDGLIVTFRDHQGTERRKEATQQALTQKPLVVLVDRQSAAASEILAAALQENQRAQLVGVNTFGNNLIQSIELLPNETAVAVTIAKWLTPKGMDINRVGIQPDVILAPTESQMKILSS